MTEQEEAKNLLLREKHTDYFPNGDIYREYHTLHGAFDGSNKIYYSNRQLSNDIMYRKGKLDGLFKMYNRQGTLITHMLYNKGKIIKDYLDD